MDRKKEAQVLSCQAKMLAFQCGNLMFRDSMNFFNMALDKFPATFNLQELYKGFFPPMWSHVENFNYRGVYPPADECCPNEMSEKKRANSWPGMLRKFKVAPC